GTQAGVPRSPAQRCLAEPATLLNEVDQFAIPNSHPRPPARLRDDAARAPAPTLATAPRSLSLARPPPAPRRQCAAPATRPARRARRPRPQATTSGERATRLAPPAP